MRGSYQWPRCRRESYEAAAGCSFARPQHAADEWTAARLIRDAAPQARILLLSQHESSNLLEDVLAMGAQGYVCKSDLARDLLGAIDGICDQQSGATQVASE